MSSIRSAATQAGGAISTPPVHAVGDLLLIFAWRDGSTATPTKPTAGGTVPAWVDILNPTGTNVCSMRSAAFVATANNHTTGVWTNATGVAMIVISGQKSGTGIAAIGGTKLGGNANATGVVDLNLGAVTLTATDGSSIVIRCVGARTVTAFGSVPSGWTSQAQTATEIEILTKNSTTSEDAVNDNQTNTFSGNGGFQVMGIEVLAGTTPVLKSQAITYNINQPITKTVALTYKVNQQIAKSLSLIYDVNVLVPVWTQLGNVAVISGSGVAATPLTIARSQDPGTILVIAASYTGTGSLSVADSRGGNSYQQDATGSDGTRQETIFSCKPANLLQSGDVVTVTFPGTFNRCFVIYQVTNLDQVAWFNSAIVAAAASGTATDSGTISLPPGHYELFGPCRQTTGSFVVGNNGQGKWYTLIDTIGNVGQGLISSQHMQLTVPSTANYKATGTLSNSMNWVQACVAYRVAAVPANTTLIDDFNRADGAIDAGAGSAIWVNTSTGGGPGYGVVASNRFGVTTAYGSPYTVKQLQADFDIEVDCSVTPTGNFSFMFALTPAKVGTGTFDCISVGYDIGSSAWWGTVYTNGGGASLGSFSASPPVAGQTYWLSRRGPVISLYRSTDGGTTYGFVGSFTTSSFMQAGPFALQMTDTVTRWDNLRGGPFVAGATPVAKTLTLSYNVRQQISKTTALTYNVRQQVAKAVAPTYKVNVSISKTVVLAYNVRKPIAKTATPTYNVNKQIAKTVAPAYNVKVVVAKSLVLNYTVRQAIVKTVVPTYNVRAYVTKVVIPNYKVNASILKTVALSYKVIKQIPKTLALNYFVRVAISKTVGPTYKVNVAVAKTVAPSYKVVAQVKKTLVLSYAVTSSGVWKSLTLNYKVNVQVGRTKGFTYNVRTTVAVKSVTPAYNTRQTVAKSISLAYNVRASVSKTTPVNYALRGMVSKSLTPTYNVKKSVGKTCTPAYSVKAQISKSLALTYNIRRTVPTVSLAVAYNVRPPAVIATLSLSYQISGGVKATVTPTYYVQRTVSKSFTVSYTIRRAVAKTLSVNYNVRVRLATALGISYRIRVVVLKSRVVSYRLINTISKSFALSYMVHKKVAKQVTPSYRVQQRVLQAFAPTYRLHTKVAKPLAVSYKVRVAVVKSVTVSYRLRIVFANPLVIRYSVRQQVKAAVGISYRLHVARAKPLVLTYKIQAHLRQSITLAYGVAGPVSKTLALQYRIRTDILVPGDDPISGSIGLAVLLEAGPVGEEFSSDLVEARPADAVLLEAGTSSWDAELLDAKVDDSWLLST
jgi:hypothetical protein